jgi:DNA-binding HxlR family transcriptional regulator
MLSAAGNELIPVMQAMCAWGTKHLGVQPNLPHPMAVPA